MRISIIIILILTLKMDYYAQSFALRAKYSSTFNQSIYSEYSDITFEGLFGKWNHFSIGPTIGFVDVDLNIEGALSHEPETQTTLGFIGYVFPFGKRHFKYVNIQLGVKLLYLTNLFRIPINGMDYSYPVEEKPHYSNIYVTNNFSSDICFVLEFLSNNKINYIFEVSYNTRYFDLEYRKNSYEPSYSYKVYNESKVESTFLWGIGLQFNF